MAYIDKFVFVFIIVQVAVVLGGKPYEPENDEGEKIKRLARKWNL